MTDPSSDLKCRSISSSLLIGARNGNQADWDRLVNLFHPFVYTWFRRWGVSEADTPDLVQNTFVRVYSALERFDRESDGTSFRGWIWRISRNVANSYFQEIKCAQLDSHALATIPEAADSENASDEILMLHRLLEIIQCDFNERTFALFHRSVLEGVDTEQLATEYGMKKSAIREAKRRVMNRLKEECCQLMGENVWPWSADIVDR